MHCTHCGQQLAPGTRFCPSCGTPFASPAEASNTYGAVPPPPPPPGSAAPFAPSRVLVRPRNGRMIAGVCAAFANAYGWNLILIRVILVVAALHLGLGVIAYVIAWIVIPEEPYLLPPARGV